MTMHRVQRASVAAKVFGLPATYSDPTTCPRSCPLYDSGCFGRVGGNVRLHFIEKFHRYAVNHSYLIQFLAELPRGSLWRYGIAGDLPGINEKINQAEVLEIAEVCDRRNLKAIVYSHKIMNSEENISFAQALKLQGFSINASCETDQQALLALDMGLQAVIVVSHDTPKKRIVNGVKFLTCPATKNGSIGCAQCNWCAKSDRKFVVQLPAHGTEKNKVEKKLAILSEREK